MKNKTIMRFFSLLLFFISILGFSQTPCLVNFSATLNGAPISNLSNNGQISCGETYTFCFTVNNWNTTNSNWFDGIVANFGSGWDLSTLTPLPPPPTVGGSNGNWGWYNQVQGTSGANIGVVGPGFFFDLNNDGNPGNDFGDFATVGPWTFCWSISTLSPPDCVNGQNISISVSTYGDSQVGSWGASGCGNNQVPVYNWTAISCPNAGVGSNQQICQNSGNVDLFDFISGYDPDGIWTDQSGSVVNNIIPVSSGTWVYTILGQNCPPSQSFVNIIESQLPNSGSDTTIVICESVNSFDLNSIYQGGIWINSNGNPIDLISPIILGEYYFITSNPPCPNDTSTLVLLDYNLPDPGQSQIISICPDGVINLFDIIQTNYTSGIWTYGGNLVNNFVDTQNSQSGIWTYAVFGDSVCLGVQLSSQVDITIFDQPNSDFFINPQIGCVPMVVQFGLINQFTGQSTWLINGDVILGNSGEYIFNSSGNWEIQNFLTSLDGCQSEGVGWATSVDPPNAEFYYLPSDPLILDNLEVNFYPIQDSEYLNYFWTINGIPQNINPWVPNYESGQYEVCLVVTDTIGCQDIECKEITLYDPFMVWVPNSFTPNGDGVNDIFFPVVSQEGYKISEFLIFDRWGQEVFKSSNQFEFWNGSRDNIGSVLQSGVYTWKVIVSSSVNKFNVIYFGHVTLLK